jgi:hypothetical protein
MTLNEPLVQIAGRYSIAIYAYNNDFASPPVTAKYEVQETDIQRLFNDTEYPIFDYNGEEVYETTDDNGEIIYKKSSNDELISIEDLNKLVPLYEIKAIILQ